MKRVAALVSYSHDHHHALSQARRLVRARSGDDEARTAAARTFLEFFECEALEHFRDEEARLFPGSVFGHPSK